MYEYIDGDGIAHSTLLPAGNPPREMHRDEKYSPTENETMSVTSLGKPIALGRTAEIYAWEQGQVLKLFQDWFSADRVEYEAQIAHAVHTSGLPVPAVGEVVEINGRCEAGSSRLI